MARERLFRSYSPSLLALIILAIAAYRFFVLYTSDYNLYADEAYYFGWAQHFAFGYFSKPPMVAWLIMLTTSLCGDGEVCVKSGALLVYPVTTWVVYLIGRRLFDDKVGFISALVFYTLPLVFLSSLIISTDVALLLFWALALYFFILALDEGKRLFWILTGLSAGLGLLSKYTMILFLLSALLYLWHAKRHRQVLRGRDFYLAIAVAALVFVPNVVWNINNDFATVAHTTEISHLDTAMFRADSLGKFLASQFIVFGLVFFGVFLALVLLPGRIIKDERFALLWFFSVPFLAIIVLQSLLARAHANWAAPTYIGAVILVVAYLTHSGRAFLLRAGIAVNILFGLLLYHYHAVADLMDIELTANMDPYKNVQGWDRLAAEVQPVLEEYGAPLLGDERRTLAELIYYIAPHPFDAVAWNLKGGIRDHYQLTTEMKIGDSFVYVTARDYIEQVLMHFRRTTKIKDIKIDLYKDYALRYRVYYLEFFTGYGDRSQKQRKN